MQISPNSTWSSAHPIVIAAEGTSKKPWRKSQIKACHTRTNGGTIPTKFTRGFVELLATISPMSTTTTTTSPTTRWSSCCRMGLSLSELPPKVGRTMIRGCLNVRSMLRLIMLLNLLGIPQIIGLWRISGEEAGGKLASSGFPELSDLIVLWVVRHMFYFRSKLKFFSSWFSFCICFFDIRRYRPI